jgi:hypothetical protein
VPAFQVGPPCRLNRSVVTRLSPGRVPQGNKGRPCKLTLRPTCICYDAPTLSLAVLTSDNLNHCCPQLTTDRLPGESTATQQKFLHALPPV